MDSRFIVTNLTGQPKSLYEKVYCARIQAENLIKAHKLHLAFDRISCTKATANQFQPSFRSHRQRRNTAQAERLHCWRSRAHSKNPASLRRPGYRQTCA
nr:transposase [Azospirillum sp. B4]